MGDGTVRIENMVLGGGVLGIVVAVLMEERHPRAGFWICRFGCDMGVVGVVIAGI